MSATAAKPEQRWWHDPVVQEYLLKWVPCFVYIGLYVVVDVLIAAQGHQNEITMKRQFDYTPGVLILLSESGKFIISFSIFIGTKIYDHYNPPQQMYQQLSSKEEAEADADEEKKVAPSQPKVEEPLTNLQRLSYCVPAVLYTFWNIINYVSLLNVSLSMYSVLYQSVVFFSAFLWCVTFGKVLSGRQWVALLLLAMGVFLVHVKKDFKFHLEITALWVFLQAFISAVGSVANEFLYKKVGGRHITIHEQNSYLYFFSIITTALYLLASEGPLIFLPEYFFRGFAPVVGAIITLNIMIGLTVSMILKHCNVIVKLFAQAIHSPLEVMTAHYVLGTELTAMIAVASFLIAFSTWLYYQPVKPAPSKYQKQEDVTAQQPMVLPEDPQQPKPAGLWNKSNTRKI